MAAERRTLAATTEKHKSKTTRRPPANKGQQEKQSAGLTHIPRPISFPLLVAGNGRAERHYY